MGRASTTSAESGEQHIRRASTTSAESRGQNIGRASTTSAERGGPIGRGVTCHSIMRDAFGDCVMRPNSHEVCGARLRTGGHRRGSLGYGAAAKLRLRRIRDLLSDSCSRVIFGVVLRRLNSGWLRYRMEVFFVLSVLLNKRPNGVGRVCIS